MEPIDRPFRFTLDFYVVWAVLVAPAYFWIESWANPGPLISFVSMVILTSLAGTFCIYGPVLLARQIVSSGPRGWFVARVALSALMIVALQTVFVYISGHGKPLPVTWTGTSTFIAIAYLHWRAGRGSSA
jgi:hypothetical protein